MTGKTTCTRKQQPTLFSLFSILPSKNYPSWNFHIGGLKFEILCQRKQGICFWVELVAPGGLPLLCGLRAIA
uniref:Putative ovule protein n=1 Tax=Solanum chacoense TaxID=4108 RepID=A0A0V0H9G8_SOLCH